VADIKGSFDDLFSAVPDALAALLDAGDVGGSAAVFVDGEMVVDVWGGFADADRTIPWQRDTIVNVWSVTKTAGLPNWGRPTTAEDLYDWPTATARLAAQAPQWDPGTAAGYHSITQGFLVGEVVRRITGRSLGAFFADEVAGPLGADFHIGLPAEYDHWVALSVPPPSRDEDYAASAPGNRRRAATVHGRSSSAARTAS
jgi:CubicO group peptidase (beta-lactamase class C family)